MKDSGVEWIGEIPEEWKVERTKYFYSTHKNIAGSESSAYERLALTMKGVVKRSKIDNTGLQPDNFDTYQILYEGELVFKLIDLQNISTSRVGLSPYTGLVSPAYIILKPHKNVVPEFGQYYFLSMWHREIFNHLGDDGVRSSLNSHDLLGVPYPILCCYEQRRIADYLDAKCAEIDKVVEKTRETIEEYKKLKQSIITETVTKGLNPDAEMKDSGIEWVGTIPEHWNVRPLYVYFGERKNPNDRGEENNLLSLSYGRIIRKDINTNEGLLPASFNTYNIVEAGDIIIRPTDLQNDKRSLRTGLAKERGIITSAYIALHPLIPQDTRFFHYLLHSYDVTKVFYNLGSGVRQGLNFSEFSKLMVFEPQHEEQSAIADYLDAKCAELDSIIEKKEQLIEELGSYKKSLIYEYVTGKKEVQA